MNARSYGLTSSSLIPQSDFSAQQNEQGRWTANQSFKLLQSALDFFTGQQKLLAGTPATTLDPDLPNFYSFLKFQNFEIQHQEAGWATIEASFVGFWSASYQGSGSELPTTYTLSGSLEEAPLLEHAKVIALSSEERALLYAIADGTAEWDIANSKIGSRSAEDGTFTDWSDQGLTTGDAVVFAELLAKGFTSFKLPRFTWTKQEEDTGPISDSRVNNLGKIDTPEGTPPEPNGSRDWMLVAADSVQRGTSNSVFSNTLTWLLSDREGWDSELYS